jgi:hypothetical protein
MDRSGEMQRAEMLWGIKERARPWRVMRKEKGRNAP